MSLANVKNSSVKKYNPGSNKFTPGRVKIILRCVGRGMPLHMACEVAGICAQSLYNWRHKNPKFGELLTRAIAKGVDSRLRRIEKASDAGDWRAAAWLLERTMPQHFARSRLEVTGAEGAPLMAGVTLYLPKKDGQPESPTQPNNVTDIDAETNIDVTEAQVTALPEGGSNGTSPE